MEFVKNFTPPEFQAKTFTPSISANFNSFGDKNKKNEWKWRNLHRWQKFCTAAGSDGSDKFHLWSIIQQPRKKYNIDDLVIKCGWQLFRDWGTQDHTSYLLFFYTSKIFGE